MHIILLNCFPVEYNLTINEKWQATNINITLFRAGNGKLMKYFPSTKTFVKL